jgi:ABC-type phosphate/phosphonate transport system substrate-binding protein
MKAHEITLQVSVSRRSAPKDPDSVLRALVLSAGPPDDAGVLRIVPVATAPVTGGEVVYDIVIGIVASGAYDMLKRFLRRLEDRLEAELGASMEVTVDIPDHE